MTSIYILALKQGKYYVGKSAHPVFRIQQHIRGEGSLWTKIWGFKSVIEVTPDTTIFKEDTTTKEWMLKRGICNVRGGSFSSPLLSLSQVSLLQKEFDTALHTCFKCGAPFLRGHICERLTQYCYYCTRLGHRIETCEQRKTDAVAADAIWNTDREIGSGVEWCTTFC